MKKLLSLLFVAVLGFSEKAFSQGMFQVCNFDFDYTLKDVVAYHRYINNPQMTRPFTPTPNKPCSD